MLSLSLTRCDHKDNAYARVEETNKWCSYKNYSINKLTPIRRMTNPPATLNLIVRTTTYPNRVDKNNPPS